MSQTKIKKVLMKTLILMEMMTQMSVKGSV